MGMLLDSEMGRGTGRGMRMRMRMIDIQRRVSVRFDSTRIDHSEDLDLYEMRMMGVIEY